MTEQLIDIGRRLSDLRQIQGYELEDFARRMDIAVSDLEAVEKGERDFSFSFLYNAAGLLGVDVVDLMSGDSPRLSTCCLVRRGGGYDVNRQAAYSYKHLAFTFRGKLAEPFMVTTEPAPDGKPPQPHAHDGQEFEYLVSGGVRFILGDAVYTLDPGDSVYFDAGIPHATEALDEKSATFLAVVMGTKKEEN